GIVSFFTLVQCFVETVGNSISSQYDNDFVSYTGSGTAGSQVMQHASEDIRKVALEVGGKSPLVVLDDADVAEAARIALHNIANNTGQVCSAATRVIIPSTMKKEFESAMKEETDKLTVGDPIQDNKIGPLVAEKQ